MSDPQLISGRYSSDTLRYYSSNSLPMSQPYSSESWPILEAQAVAERALVRRLKISGQTWVSLCMWDIITCMNSVRLQSLSKELHEKKPEETGASSSKISENWVEKYWLLCITDILLQQQKRGRRKERLKPSRRDGCVSGWWRDPWEGLGFRLNAKGRDFMHTSNKFDRVNDSVQSW